MKTVTNLIRCFMPICLIALMLVSPSSHAFGQGAPVPPPAPAPRNDTSWTPPEPSRRALHENWIEEKAEMTRLDSILSFGNRAKSMDEPSRAIAIEQYAMDYPNSPALQLAIGRSFLYNSTYYDALPNRGSSCADTINYDFSDSAFHWLSLAHSDKALRDPEYQLTTSAWLAQAYAALIFDKIRAHDAPTVRRLLINAMLDSVIDPFSLNFATELMAETPKEAILFVGQTEVGSNALLPLWYLQVVERVRTDVSIVHSDFLVDDSYRGVVMSGLEGVMRGVQFVSHISAHMSDTSDSRNEQYAEVYDTAFVAASYRNRIALETGIAQPAFFVTKISASHKYIHDEMVRIRSGNGWKRPVYLTPMEESEHLGVIRVAGFVSEWLPADDSTSTEFLRRHPQDSAIGRLFEDKRSRQFLARTDHDHFNDLALSLAETAVASAKDRNGSASTKIVASFWSMPVAKDTLQRVRVAQLLLPILANDPPPDAATFSDNVADRIISFRRVNTGSYIPSEAKSLYVEIKSALGKCEEVHRLSTTLATLALLDTNDDGHNLKELSKDLVEESEKAGCSWAPPRVDITMLSPPAESETHYGEHLCKVGDTVKAIVGIESSNPTVNLIVKWYDATRSTLIKIDSSTVTLEKFPQWERLTSKLLNGNGIFQMLITKELRSGSYRADVLCNGLFVGSGRFTVEGADDAE